MINPNHMKLSVYRYKVWDPQNDNQAQLPPYYAIREYIEQLKGASVIEDNYLIPGTKGLYLPLQFSLPVICNPLARNPGTFGAESLGGGPSYCLQ